jgi:glycosyltransferase involved in cell wall biosynthesis
LRRLINLAAGPIAPWLAGHLARLAKRAETTGWNLKMVSAGGATRALAAAGLRSRWLPFLGPLDVASPLATRLIAGGREPAVLVAWTGRAARALPYGWTMRSNLLRIGCPVDLAAPTPWLAADHLVVGTVALAEAWIDAGWPPTRIHVVPVPVEAPAGAGGPVVGADTAPPGVGGWAGGRPVIARASAVTAGLVAPGRDGLLVAGEADARDAATALADEPDRADRLARAGHARWRRAHAPEAVADAWLGLVDRLASGV